MANNKNPRSRVKGSVVAHLINSNTNATMTRAALNTATQNGVSHRAHLLGGNAANNVVISGLANSAMPTNTQTQYVRPVGQGIVLKKAV